MSPSWSPTSDWSARVSRSAQKWRLGSSSPHPSRRELRGHRKGDLGTHSVRLCKQPNVRGKTQDDDRQRQMGPSGDSGRTTWSGDSPLHPVLVSGHHPFNAVTILRPMPSRGSPLRDAPTGDPCSHPPHRGEAARGAPALQPGGGWPAPESCRAGAGRSCWREWGCPASVVCRPVPGPLARGPLSPAEVDPTLP